MRSRLLPLVLALTSLALTACGEGVRTTRAGDAKPAPLRLSAAPTAAKTWAPWPQAGRDGSRSGASTALGPVTGRIRWSRSIGIDATPGPVIGPDGTVFAASSNGILHALDPRDGHDLWTYNAHAGYGGDLSISPAVLPDSRVLWTGPHDDLLVFARGGRLLGSVHFAAGPTSPAISRDATSAYVGDRGGGLTALDLSTPVPTVRWRLQLSSEVSYGSAAISPADPRRVYQTTVGALFAVDDRGSHGVVRWHVSDSSVVEVSPAVSPDGIVVFGDNGRTEWGISASGARLWRYRRDARDSYSSPVVTPDGEVWFGDHAAQVTALDVTTGRVLARHQGDRVQRRRGRSVGVWTSVAVDSARNAYWGTRSGHVYGFAADGRMLFDIDARETVESYPALGLDGLLVVGVTDGRLLGIADDGAVAP